MNQLLQVGGKCESLVCKGRKGLSLQRLLTLGGGGGGEIRCLAMVDPDVVSQKYLDLWYGLASPLGSYSPLNEYEQINNSQE